MKVEIIRDWSDENQTTGTCNVYDDKGRLVFSALSLERGDQQNKRNVSRINNGTYPLVLEYSHRFKKELWEIKETENRSECKFHSANYWYQLNGCIALGLDLKDINRDGYRDVTSSRLTMSRFHKALKGYTKATLVVKKINKCCY